MATEWSHQRHFERLRLLGQRSTNPRASIDNSSLEIILLTRDRFAFSGKYVSAMHPGL